MNVKIIFKHCFYPLFSCIIYQRMQTCKQKDKRDRIPISPTKYPGINGLTLKDDAIDAKEQIHKQKHLSVKDVVKTLCYESEEEETSQDVMLKQMNQNANIEYKTELMLSESGTTTINSEPMIDKLEIQKHHNRYKSESLIKPSGVEMDGSNVASDKVAEEHERTAKQQIDQYVGLLTPKKDEDTTPPQMKRFSYTQGVIPADYQFRKASPEQKRSLSVDSKRKILQTSSSQDHIIERSKAFTENHNECPQLSTEKQVLDGVPPKNTQSSFSTNCDNQDLKKSTSTNTERSFSTTYIVESSLGRITSRKHKEKF